MAPRKRKPRASAEDIYATCKIWGNCPPDVQNKIENNTWADRFLKWASLGIFLGGLGIGTSRGTGGRFGYRPLTEGTTSGTRPGSAIIRPNIPPETIPAGSLPGDALDAASSSIIPMTDLSGESSIVDTLPEPVPGPSQPADTGPAVIDVGEPPTKRVTVSQTEHTNPSFEPTTHETSHTGGLDVSLGVSSTTVGAPLRNVGEEIALQTFNGPGETSGMSESFSSTIIETEFGASTPISRTADVVRPRGPALYSRANTQVRVTDPLFLSRPYQLVDFENPAFNPDVSAEFEQDLNELNIAPHEDFQNVARLGRPIITRRNTGVRVSRLGQKHVMQTRSGLAIGPRVHYYYDLSSINAGDLVEPEIIGEESGGHTLVSHHTNAEHVGEEFELVPLINPEEQPTYEDEDLLDHVEEVGRNLQLVIGGGRRRAPLVHIPMEVPNIAKFTPGVTIAYPGPTTDNSPVPPFVPPGGGSVTPSVIGPPIQVSYNMTDFYFDPDLYRKRKRRRYFY